jgi:hypothetical protein
MQLTYCEFLYHTFVVDFELSYNYVTEAVLAESERSTPPNYLHLPKLSKYTTVKSSMHWVVSPWSLMEFNDASEELADPTFTVKERASRQ